MSQLSSYMRMIYLGHRRRHRHRRSRSRIGVNVEREGDFFSQNLNLKGLN